MAEPLDYFFQGANLGMRAGAARTQQEQFRTNLAERARQFDLNREIALGNLDLRRKEFGLAQENAVLRNQMERIEIEEAGLRAKDLKRTLDDRETYTPVIQSYQKTLDNWDGIGEPPPAPTDVPIEISSILQGMRISTSEAVAKNDLIKTQRLASINDMKMKAEELAYVNKVRPDLVYVDDKTGLRTVRREDYLELKRRERELKQQQPRPNSIAAKIQEFREKFADKFYVKDPQNPDAMIYDFDGFRQAMAAYTGLRLDPNFGVPTNGNEGDGNQNETGGNQNEQGGLNNKKKKTKSQLIEFLRGLVGNTVVAPLGGAR